MIDLFKKKPVIVSLAAVAIIAAVIIFTITTDNKLAGNQKAANKTTVSSNTKNNVSTVNNESSLNNTNTTESNAVNADEANGNATVATADNTASDTVKNSANTDSVANNSNISNNGKNTTTESEVYISKTFGLKMTFPEDWVGKYTVNETQYGILVCFKAKNPPPNCQGIIFEIIKKTPETHEETIDTMAGVPRYFTSGNTTFVIGHTTDIGFPDSSAEYKDYKVLESKTAEVVNTLQSISK